MNSGSDATMRDQVVEAIAKASNWDAPPSQDLELGFSGGKVLCLLESLAKVALQDESSVYLEIGVYRGLTLSTVARAVPERRVFGVDNFSQTNEDGSNKSRVLSLLKERDINTATLIDEDFESALSRLGDWLGDSRIGLFFVDGPHDYRSQLLCLLMATPWLSENALIVVDDCNYEHVRLANSDFLNTHPNFAVLYQAYTRGHPSIVDNELSRRGWWNGINVIGARKIASEPQLIDIGNAKERSSRLHYIQAHSYYDHLSYLIKMCSNIATFSNYEAAKEIYRLYKWLRKHAPAPRRPVTHRE